MWTLTDDTSSSGFHQQDCEIPLRTALEDEQPSTRALYPVVLDVFL